MSRSYIRARLHDYAFSSVQSGFLHKKLCTVIVVVFGVLLLQMSQFQVYVSHLVSSYTRTEQQLRTREGM